MLLLDCLAKFHSIYGAKIERKRKNNKQVENGKGLSWSSNEYVEVNISEYMGKKGKICGRKTVGAAADVFFWKLFNANASNRIRFMIISD